MPIPEFVAELRRHVGTAPLWLPAVTAVVLRGTGDRREVLLVQRADNGRWTPVTGILDPGEQPADGAAREVLEETGVVVRVDRLASVAAGTEVVHVNGDRAVYLDHTFACTYVSGEAHVADDESADVRWARLDDLGALSEEHRERVAAATSDEVAPRLR